MNREGLLRIGQLARQAGVARGTIQHYLREGLLPRPKKTHRNMAYYEPACVDRIRLIKELQTKHYLPLSQIRELLANGSHAGALTQAIVHANEAALSSLAPAVRSEVLSFKEASRVFRIRADVLEELVAEGVISVRRGADGAEPTLGGADLEVLAAVVRLRDLGFTEKAGFRASDLGMYRRALDRLLEDEVRTFMRVLGTKRGAKVVGKLARSAVEGATLLIMALRKKSILDLLARTGPTS
jgi:DNA-binding transcriptional MerR regulator